VKSPTDAVQLLLLVTLAVGCGGTSPPGGPAGDDGPPDGIREVAIARIQGQGHVSPLLGERVATRGVVTAITGPGFHLQDPDGDGEAATSDAIVVAVGGETPSVGDRVRVTGRVAEHRPGGEGTGNLTVTRLEAEELEVLAGGAPLPEPVRLGTGGRTPPQERVIGEDELPVDLSDPEEAADNEFDPDTEGIDYYESLEAMRVTVPEPVAVSPTATFDDGASVEVFALADDGAHVTPDDARTDRGGLLLQPHPDNRGDQNPERVQLQFEAGLYPGPIPTLAVGDGLGDATGVLGYGFGNFEVLVTGELPVRPSDLEAETTGIAGGDGVLTLGVYNVLNMNPLPETDARRARLARQIVDHLGSPDVLALQEIQDENGTRGGEGDTETDATATLDALVEAVVAAGGPRYEHADVAPAPNSTGGVPGGNIRNAFLYHPDRVRLTELRLLDRETLAAAGASDPEAFEGSRRPLAATFDVGGVPLTVVSHHGTSRYGSTPIFGAVQPFVQAGEEAREAQARALHDWVDASLQEAPGARIAVVGDFNTFEFTDDLARILSSGGGGETVLYNLMRNVAPGERYSYVFEGNSQALDHAFVTEALRQGAELDPVHLNAEFPEGRRASDHEPLVVRLVLE
jgi:predicted extracellular nuclease